jgi:RNA binding exosome subunit
MVKGPIDRSLQSVQISAIAHATDDLDKVHLALRFLLPDSLKAGEVFTRRYVQGHHGNPIVTFEARLTKPQQLDQFAHHFARKLARREKLLIQHDLERHCDDRGNLYIRLDKQQAFRGALELSDDDPIRVKLKFSRLGGDAEELMNKFLESD